MPSTDIQESARLSRNHIALKLETIGLALLVLPVVIVLLATIGFAAGRNLSAWLLLPSAMLCILCVRIFSGSWRLTAMAVGLAAMVYYAGYTYAIRFFDSSWDGLFYHQEAALQLAEGWNPLFEDADDIIEYYPKASWISAATLFLFTEKIEAGKVFHFALIVAAGCFVAAILFRFTSFGFLTIGLIAFVSAANPVAIYQSTTYLNDGLVASSLTILIAHLSAYALTLRRQDLVVAFFAALFLINLKFSSFAYVSMLLALMGCAVWALHGYRTAFRAAAFGAITILVGVVFLGYAPYARNFVKRDALLYPLQGKGKEEFHRLMMSQVPPNLRNRNRVTRFLMSNFAKTDDGWNIPAVLKFPFLISRSEVDAFRHTVIRNGGFGPLFGLLLILTSLALVASLVHSVLPQQHALFFLSLTAVIVITIFIHDIGWWARFAPQAWLLPLLWAIAVQSTKVRWLRWLGRGIVALAFVNVIFLTGSFLYKQRIYTVQWNARLKSMRSADQPVAIDLSHFLSLRQRLREAGIRFQILSSPAPANVKRFPIPGYEPMYWIER